MCVCVGGGGWVLCVKTVFVSSARKSCYFFSRFKAKIFFVFLDKVKAIFFCFVFDNHIIQANHPELLIKAY